MKKKLTDEELKTQLKEDFKKKGEELTDEQAEDAIFRLRGLAEIAFDVVMEKMRREKRLKQEPQGFALEGGYSCPLCRVGTTDVGCWYDRHGLKCMFCQKALNDGIIPAFVFKNEYSYYSMYDLNSKFKIKTQRAQKLIKEGLLLTRAVLTTGGSVHYYIFLKKENPKLASAERFNPVWKSRKRNEAKRSAADTRESIRKIRAERMH